MFLRPRSQARRTSGPPPSGAEIGGAGFPASPTSLRKIAFPRGEARRRVQNSRIMRRRRSLSLLAGKRPCAQLLAHGDVVIVPAVDRLSRGAGPTMRPATWDSLTRSDSAAACQNAASTGRACIAAKLPVQPSVFGRPGRFEGAGYASDFQLSLMSGI